MSVTDTAYAFVLRHQGESNLRLPNLGFAATDEDFFYYIYAVLHAPTYRMRYDEYLCKGYPRIPLPASPGQLAQLADLGRRLADAHLLRGGIHPSLELSEDPPEDWRVDAIAYRPETHTLYFRPPSAAREGGDGPWIKGITPAMWAYSIGGIPQIEQFLRSRAYSPARKWNTLQRALDYTELGDLLRICSAIRTTVEILPQIDDAYRQVDDMPD